MAIGAGLICAAGAGFCFAMGMVSRQYRIK
jgi:hypothetical protein